MRFLPAILAVAIVAASGCITDSGKGPVDPLPPAPAIGSVLNATVVATMAFTEQVVDAAVDVTGDLYEPTVDVCADGSIYITAHTIAADTTGAPVFGSHDGGMTWAQLPAAGPVALPSPLQGATPPPSDEIFLSCGDDDWLYGVDITLATFPVNGWSGNGGQLGYYNPNAYDEAQVGPQTSADCQPTPAKDRPWGAYANGTLLMVSNPASGPAQVGVLTLPPALPVGLGATVGGGSWNLCAGPGTGPASCRIPGIPDLRADGRFAVPQLCGVEPTDLVGMQFASDFVLHLVTGNTANVMETEIVQVFPNDTGGEITSVYGIAAFDAEGTLFVGVTNNTKDGDDKGVGQMRFAVSTDGGATFANRTFTTGKGPVRHFYMDANDNGAGALVVWAKDGETEGAYDWFIGHLMPAADGGLALNDVALAIDEGPQPSAHVTGAAVGPDGRAYLAMYRSPPPAVGPLGAMPNTPLSVYVQQDGPMMPVLAAAPAPV